MGITDETINSGMKLVLNYGKEIDSTISIPVQWYFDETTITKNPTDIIIVEQNRQETENKDYADILGQRYGCKASEGIYFIQFLEPGHHRIAIYAFNNEKVGWGRFWGTFLGRDSQRVYQRSINSNMIVSDDCNGVLAFAMVVVNIFAK